MVVILDTGPLGIITNPNNTAETMALRKWLTDILVAGHEVAIPEIADYELRRELIRSSKTKSITRLDMLQRTNSYLHLTTVAMRRAAEVWADARNRGKPMADDKALDGDAILIAQAELHPSHAPVVVATTNVGHLSLYINAKVWDEISP